MRGVARSAGQRRTAHLGVRCNALDIVNMKNLAQSLPPEVQRDLELCDIRGRQDGDQDEAREFRKFVAEHAIEGLARSLGEELGGLVDLPWGHRLRACHRYFVTMLDLHEQVVPDPRRAVEVARQERLVRGLVRLFEQCIADEGDLAAGEAGA